jgi:hypothetical protein
VLNACLYFAALSLKFPTIAPNNLQNTEERFSQLNIPLHYSQSFRPSTQEVQSALLPFLSCKKSCKVEDDFLSTRTSVLKCQDPSMFLNLLARMQNVRSLLPCRTKTTADEIEV